MKHVKKPDVSWQNSSLMAFKNSGYRKRGQKCGPAHRAVQRWSELTPRPTYCLVHSMNVASIKIDRKQRLTDSLQTYPQLCHTPGTAFSLRLTNLHLTALFFIVTSHFSINYREQRCFIKYGKQLETRDFLFVTSKRIIALVISDVIGRMKSQSGWQA